MGDRRDVDLFLFLKIQFEQKKNSAIRKNEVRCFFIGYFANIL